MITKESIINQTLVMLGEEPVSELNGSTRGSIAIERIYEQCKQDVLRMYEWNCALTTTRLAEQVACHSCWDHVYSWPNKTERIIKVVESKVCEEEAEEAAEESCTTHEFEGDEGAQELSDSFTFEGDTIYNITIKPSGRFWLYFSGNNPHSSGYDTITLTFESLDTLDLTWNAGSGRYDADAPAGEDHYDEAASNDELCFTISGDFYN